MSQVFQVKHPLPSRRAAEVLRQQIVDHLVETRPAIGEPFLSDHQLARVAGLSRPTVRRALDSLSREGWTFPPGCAGGSGWSTNVPTWKSLPESFSAGNNGTMAACWELLDREGGAPASSLFNFPP